MIRIETTAEFDAEGRFTVTAQGPTSLSAGLHRVVVLLDASDQETVPAAEPRPALVCENGLLLLNAEPAAGADWDIQALIEADREERMAQILGDWKP